MTYLAPQYDHLVFDLDDTLLDTSRYLIPIASRDACRAMIESGLNASFEACAKAVDEIRRGPSRRDVFEQVVERFGARGSGISKEQVALRGAHAFYQRNGKVAADISLFTGVNATLLSLAPRYTLNLVTAGHPATQEEKIRILGIRPLFTRIIVVDPSIGERKGSAFSEIMRESRKPPARHLSIGNRVETDIAEARSLGWKACWVRYGEHAAHEPANESEQPDFTIHHISELVSTCRL